MSQNYKYKYFQYYRDYYFFKKLDIDSLEKFKSELLDKELYHFYSFIITLLCRYCLDNNQHDKFFEYLAELKNIAATHKGYSLLYSHINEGYYIFLSSKDLDKAIEHFKKALKIYQENKFDNPHTLYTLYQYMGVTYYKMSDDISAYDLLQKALECDLNETFKFHKAMTYNWLAIIEDKHHFTAQALQKALKSAHIYKRYSIENRYCDVLNTVGLLYLELKHFDNAISVFEESIEIAKKTNQIIIIADAYNNLGMLYYEIKNYKLSEENYLQSLEYRPITDIKKTYYTLNNLGNTCREMAGYDKSEKYLLDSLHKAKPLQDDLFISQIYGNLAVMFLKKKEFDKALEYLKLSESLANNFQDTIQLKRIYQTYIDYYNQKEDYQKTNQYWQLFTEKLQEDYENKLDTTVKFIKGSE